MAVPIILNNFLNNLVNNYCFVCLSVWYSTCKDCLKPWCRSERTVPFWEGSCSEWSLLSTSSNKPETGELFGVPKSTVSKLIKEETLWQQLTLQLANKASVGRHKREDSNCDDDTVAKVTHAAARRSIQLFCSSIFVEQGFSNTYHAAPDMRMDRFSQKQLVKWSKLL